MDQGSDPLDPDSRPQPLTLGAWVGNQTIYLRWDPPTTVIDQFYVEVEQRQRNGSIFQLVDTFPFASDSVEDNSVTFSTAFPNDVPVSNGDVYRLTVKAEREGVRSEASNAVLAVPGEAAAMEKPAHPLLFLHGFAGRGRDTFKKTLHFLENTLRWTDGGHLFHQGADTTKNTLNFDRFGDFFTVDFGNKLADYPTLSDAEGGYAHQGTEVAYFVSDLKSSGVRFPLALVAHSNGGLAARAFLVNFNSDNYSSLRVSPDEDIGELVTYGTPHRGADSVRLANIVKAGFTYVTNLVGYLFTSFIDGNLSEKQGTKDSTLISCNSSNNPYGSPFLNALNNIRHYRG